MKKYYPDLPTLPDLYPNNSTETQIVKNRLRNITPQEKYMFQLSDLGLEKIFASLAQKNTQDIQDLLQNTINPHILSIKDEINRARPYQFDQWIKDNRLPSDTVHTPAFPAGHTMQSLFLAKILSREYPKKSQLFHDVAEAIGQSRIAAGHHFPSDHEYGKWLINYLFT